VVLVCALAVHRDAFPMLPKLQQLVASGPGVDEMADYRFTTSPNSTAGDEDLVQVSKGSRVVKLREVDAEPLCQSTVGAGMTFFTFWTTEQTTFTSRYLRSIESVFYHHGAARVIVYSNSLATDFFSDLEERGCHIVVEPILLK